MVSCLSALDNVPWGAPQPPLHLVPRQTSPAFPRPSAAHPGAHACSPTSFRENTPLLSTVGRPNRWMHLVARPLRRHIDAASGSVSMRRARGMSVAAGDWWLRRPRCHRVRAGHTCRQVPKRCHIPRTGFEPAPPKRLEPESSALTTPPPELWPNMEKLEIVNNSCRPARTTPHSSVAPGDMAESNTHIPHRRSPAAQAWLLAGLCLHSVGAEDPSAPHMLATAQS